MVWYKIILYFFNVNGKVKSRFVVYEDFVIIVGKGFFREFILYYFDMFEELSEIFESYLLVNVYLFYKEKCEKIFY